MKYLPLRQLDDITNALNFDTAECRVVGACDIYTTKAAGSDKKLYKNIETSLESKYESLLRFSASLSPPQASSAAATLNLSRSSPFGPLSQISSRRTFAYLIATLNASHPDYDFSRFLRPTDFRREKSLRHVMNTLDTTLLNLRPKASTSNLSRAQHWSPTVTSSVPPTPSAGQAWNPKMWLAIDKEMTLKDCNIYCYSPEENPYDDEEEPTIWSFNYFFFNKARKRVCYIYLRGLSIMSNDNVPRTPMGAGLFADGEETPIAESGATKRASFWLGDRAMNRVQGGWDEDDDEDDDQSSQSNVHEPRLLPPEEHAKWSLLSPDEAGSPFSDRSGSLRSMRSRSKSTVRGMSEEMVQSMEV